MINSRNALRLLKTPLAEVQQESLPDRESICRYIGSSGHIPKGK
jgi:hypothetical protein